MPDTELTKNRKAVQHDLARTIIDLARLQACETNLSLFIQDSDGEDRSAFRLCLMRLQVAIDEGKALKAKIESALEQIDRLESGAVTIEPYDPLRRPDPRTPACEPPLP